MLAELQSLHARIVPYRLIFFPEGYFLFFIAVLIFAVHL